MFSLIITVLSIGLVAALAIAALYYGVGTADEAGARARAATLVNQGEQIVAAARLYYVSTSRPLPSLQVLVEDGYLTALPVPVGATLASSSFSIISEAVAADTASWSWDASTQTLALVKAVGAVSTCEQVNNLSFNSKTVQDAVDTRFRVQCYGEQGSKAYTVIWNANTPADVQIGGKYALCQGTEHINHIPSVCGSSVAEGSPVVPPPVSNNAFGDYLNALSPVNVIPDLPTGWSPRADATCSNPMSATSNPVPLEYVVTTPGDALLAIKFVQSWSFENAVDYWGMGYNVGYGTATRVVVDGQVVYDQGTDPYNSQEIATTPLFVSKGTHLVRIESTVRAVLMDGLTYTELPWSEAVPAPAASTCVSQFQNAAVVKPSGASGSVPPAGQLAVTGSCAVDTLPSLVRVSNFNYYCPVRGSVTWGDLSYAVQASNVVIRGTKETLDGLDSYGLGVGSVFADGPAAGTTGSGSSPGRYLNGECAALGDTSPYEKTYGAPPAGVTRVSDTEIWITSATSNWTRGNNCIGDACFDFVAKNADSAYPKNLTLALLRTSWGGESTPVAVSDVACTPVSGRSTPLNSWGPSCSTGFTWDAGQGTCVCQPSATTVCATPNAGLTGDIQNTSSSVTCTGGGGTLTNGKCLPFGLGTGG